MAITNAQQYQQLVKKRADGERPGYVGSDYSQDADSKGNKGTNTSGYQGGNRGTSGYQGGSYDSPSNSGDSGNFDPGPTQPQEYIGGKSFDINPTSKEAIEQKNFAISIENDRKRREDKKRSMKERTFLEKLGKLGYTDRTLDTNLEDFGAIDPQGITIGGLKVPSSINALSEFTVDPATKSFDIDSIRELASTKTTMGGSMSKTDANTLGDIREDIQMRSRIQDPNDKVTESDFQEYMNRNKIEETGGEGIQDPCKGPNPPAYCFTGLRSASAATPEVKEEEDEIINYRLMADGGRAGVMDGGRMMMMNQEEDDPVGGIMDLETSRQMYGLGKLVKKITRGVKKIAKSPVGKAALLYAGGSYLSGANNFFGGLKGAGFLKSPAIGFKNFMMGKPLGFKTAGDSVARSKGFLDMIGGKYGAGILGTSALSYFMTPEEEEEKKLYAGADIDDPSYIMNNPSLYTNRRLAAEGGSMDEPVAKKTMPLLDMDGQEMDLREEGGFVPLGRMERADDVPARLSKNEFVFTADAVRNAGEGDVDKGAEVMYNMMKNLESGGDISEESQGLEGAREMFQTSQRLEEVI